MLAWALWALVVFADVRVAILAEFLSLLAKVHSFSELTKENYFVSFVFTHNKKKTRELFPNIGNYSISLLKFRR